MAASSWQSARCTGTTVGRKVAAILLVILEVRETNSMLYGKKIIQGLIAMALLIGSAILVFGLTGYAVHSTQALAYGITIKDFQIPSGGDPWGTAFDSKGNVWVAL